jgi:hypothetical protein
MAHRMTIRFGCMSSSEPELEHSHYGVIWCHKGSEWFRGGGGGGGRPKSKASVLKAELRPLLLAVLFNVDSWFVYVVPVVDTLEKHYWR